MSKAFTREDDVETASPRRLQQPDPLPPGVKNYMTHRGAQALREEMASLAEVSGPDRSERQEREQRMAYIQQTLQNAEIVPNPPEPHDQVRFGATVLLKDRAGDEHQYRIVGIDEMDLDRDWISWRSPLARALMNARVGARVKFQAPSGTQEFTILNVSYE